MPCAANALLNEEGIPVVCETDIHGAITALMVEAAGMGETRSFFADWTIRHPDIKNGELLQHCGPWPISVAGETPKITYPLAFDHPGAITAEAKHGDITLARFDGDNGEYSLLLGNAKVWTVQKEWEPICGLRWITSTSGSEDRRGSIHSPLCGHPQGYRAGAV